MAVQIDSSQVLRYVLVVVREAARQQVHCGQGPRCWLGVWSRCFPPDYNHNSDQLAYLLGRVYAGMGCIAHYYRSVVVGTHTE